MTRGRPATSRRSKSLGGVSVTTILTADEYARLRALVDSGHRVADVLMVGVCATEPATPPP